MEQPISDLDFELWVISTQLTKDADKENLLKGAEYQSQTVLTEDGEKLVAMAAKRFAKSKNGQLDSGNVVLIANGHPPTKKASEIFSRTVSANGNQIPVTEDRNTTAINLGELDNEVIGKDIVGVA